MSRAVRASCSMLVAAAAFVTACEKPTNLVIDPKAPVLHKRVDAIQLVAHVMHGHFEDAKADVTWKSEDPNIVAVDDKGVIKGVHSGLTNVTATSDGISATVPVEVLFVDKISAVSKVEMTTDDEQGTDPKVVLTSHDGIVLKEQPMFESKNDNVCRVRGGIIWPTDAGETVVTAQLDGQSVTIPCVVAEAKTKGKRRKR